MSFSLFSSFGGSQMRSGKKTVRQSIQTSGAVTTATYTDAVGTYTQYYFLSTSGTNYIQLNNFTKTQTIFILCIGGGGGGAHTGGGGGAGGFREYSLTLNPADFTSEKITCVVGAGGAGAPMTPLLSTVGSGGGNTTVSFQNKSMHNLISQGGGGGGGRSTSGNNGASGGGSMENGSTGLSNAATRTGEYGNRGGYSPSPSWQSGSGGGGSSGAGGDSVTGINSATTGGGPGGIGKKCSINGISNILYWAGGGGGMGQYWNDLKYRNIGGRGGGGGGWSGGSGNVDGQKGWSSGGGDAYMPVSGGDAGANTGSGGGGMYYNSSPPGDPTVYRGGNGAAGIVIISFKTAGISTSTSFVEVGGSFSVKCDSPSAGGTYTITGPTPANLGVATLGPGTFTAGTILVLSYTLANISSRTDMIFTFTLSTGTVYTTTVVLSPVLTTISLYNPPDDPNLATNPTPTSFRRYSDSIAYGFNSMLNSSTYVIMFPATSSMFYIFFEKTSKIAGLQYQSRNSAPQFIMTANIEYSNDSISLSNTTSLATLEGLSYNRLVGPINTDGSWTLTSETSTFPESTTTYIPAGTRSTNFDIITDITFLAPIYGKVVRVRPVTVSTAPNNYASIRCALKYWT